MAEVEENTALLSQEIENSQGAGAETVVMEETAALVAAPEEALEKDPLAEKISSLVKESLMPEDGEFLLAKNFLTSKVGVKHPVSMYDHLTSVIMHALESKNANIVDNFEKLSMSVKIGQYSGNPQAPTFLKKSKDIHMQHDHAVQCMSQLKRPEEQAETEPPGEIPDMMELSNMWEWAGISFGKAETFLLFLSVKKLVAEKGLKSIRLWGKIYGLKRNYIIAEAELKEGAEDTEESLANEIAVIAPEVAPTDMPVPKIKKFSPLSKEVRTGANKYIYYACQKVGGDWIRLPDIIPERLQEARKVQKYLTGNLEAKVLSFPPFNGNEAQYLRCQIARISAATVISPKGYYMIDPEAEDAEESNVAPPTIINPEYEGFSNDQLRNIANWVHHVPYILPQGRAVWESPKLIKDDPPAEEGGEKDEEEEAETPAVDPEVGPAPLAPISGEEENGNISPWSARVCSKLSPAKFSPVVLRSNRWPGAHAVAYNDKFANIYIGDGLKDAGNPAQNFIPPVLGPIEKEYAIGEGAAGNPELLVEQIDPTLEAEAAFEDSKKVKEDDGKEGAGGEPEDADE